MREQYKILQEKYLNEVTPDPHSENNYKVSAKKIIFDKLERTLDASKNKKIVYKWYLKWLYAENIIDGVTTRDLQSLLESCIENAIEGYQDDGDDEIEGYQDDEDDKEISIEIGIGYFLETLSLFLTSDYYKTNARAYEELYKNNPGVNIDI